MSWVRHTWVLEGENGDEVAEAYVEVRSVADTQLQHHFESRREIEVEYPRPEMRLMKGWIRFG